MNQSEALHELAIFANQNKENLTKYLEDGPEFDQLIGWIDESINNINVLL